MQAFMMPHRSVSPALRRAAVAILGAVLGAAGVHAQTPAAGDRPVNVVSPFSAGTGSDLTARAFAVPFAKALSQNVMVSNRDGAAGVIGIQYLMQSPPDGYTLVMGPMTPLAIQPHLVKGLAISPASVDPVCNVAENLLGIVVRADSPIRNLQDLVAQARAGSVSFGSAGQNSAPHIGVERIRLVTGGNWVHVPFRGDPAAIQELLGGRLDFATTAVISAAPNVKAGKLRMIAVQSTRRHPDFPAVPTLREQGVDAYQISYTSLYAPLKTPPAVLDKLEAACKEAAASDAFRSAAASAGITIEFKTGKDFRRVLDDEYESTRKIIQAMGAQPN